MKIIREFLFFLLFLTLLGCFNPTRDNLLDPRAENYSGTVSLSGTVWSFYQPFIALSGVTVTVLPGPFITTSNEDGKFIFKNLQKGDYLIISTKNRFSSDSLQITLNPWENSTVEFHLNALPQFQNIQITSSHISRWWPVEDLYFLNIQAQVSDGDGQNDLKSVLLSIPSLAFTDTLREENPGQFSIVLEQKAMQHSNLQNLIAVPFVLIADDKAGFRTESEPVALSRVVEMLAVTEAPRGLAATSPRPVLKWRAPKTPFDHSFTVEVNRDDAGVISRVWIKNLIPASSDSIAVGKNLSAGNYFWTVSIVDNFGNSSRSKEAAFRVF